MKTSKVLYKNERERLALLGWGTVQLLYLALLLIIFFSYVVIAFRIHIYTNFLLLYIFFKFFD